MRACLVLYVSLGIGIIIRYELSIKESTKNKKTKKTTRVRGVEEKGSRQQENNAMHLKMNL